MNWLFNTLRTYPEIAIFLALALGFYVGGLKIGKFSLGNVTGVLLAGVLIGQLNITISANVKAVFFLMFLFAVGYSVGPQFFRGLKSDGLPQVLFSAIVCVACLVSVFVAAKVAGYSIGQAAGLLSGACTISAVLGVATDTVNQLGLPADQQQATLAAMPVAYAVTYLYGTAGSAWFLASIGPKLLRVDLAKECADYEAKMGGGVERSRRSFGVSPAGDPLVSGESGFEMDWKNHRRLRSAVHRAPRLHRSACATNRKSPKPNRARKSGPATSSGWPVRGTCC